VKGVTDVAEPEGLIVGSDGSRLFQVLDAVIPVALEGLGTPAAWSGWRAEQTNRSFGYARVEMVDDLCFDLPSGPQRARIAIHDFTGAPGSIGELHNHRFPLVVLPLAVDEDPSELYEMLVAERRRAAGPAPYRDQGLPDRSYSITPGVPYAIYDALGVYHSIETRRRHMSLVVGDVIRMPLRIERMTTERLPAHDVVRILRAATPGLQRHVSKARTPPHSAIRREKPLDWSGVLLD
jgi:hypothetical protein